MMGTWSCIFMISAMTLATDAVYLLTPAVSENSAYEKHKFIEDNTIDEIVIVGKDNYDTKADLPPYETIPEGKGIFTEAAGESEETLGIASYPDAPIRVPIPQSLRETVHGSNKSVISEQAQGTVPANMVEITERTELGKKQAEESYRERVQENYQDKQPQMYDVAVSYLEFGRLPLIEKVLSLRRKMEKVASWNRITPFMKGILKHLRRRARSTRTTASPSPAILDDGYYEYSNPYKRTSQQIAIPEMSAPLPTKSNWYRSQFIPPHGSAYRRQATPMRTGPKQYHRMTSRRDMGPFQVPKWKYYVPYPWKVFSETPLPLNRIKAKESPRELPYGALPRYPRNNKQYNEPMEPGILQPENMERSQQVSELQPPEPLESPIEATRFDSSRDVADHESVPDSQVQRASGVMRPNGYIGPAGLQGSLGIPNFSNFGRISSRNSFRIANELDRGPRYSPVMFDFTRFSAKTTENKEQQPLNDPSSGEESDQKSDIQDDYRAGSDYQADDRKPYQTSPTQSEDINIPQTRDRHHLATSYYPQYQRSGGNEINPHRLTSDLQWLQSPQSTSQLYNNDAILHGRSPSVGRITDYYGKASDGPSRILPMSRHLTLTQTTGAPSTRYHIPEPQKAHRSDFSYLNYPTGKETPAMSYPASYPDKQSYSPGDNFDIYKNDYALGGISTPTYEKPTYEYGKSGYGNGFDSYEQIGGSLGYGGGYGDYGTHKSLSSSGGYGLNSVGSGSGGYGHSSPTIIKVPTYKPHKDDKSMQWTSGYQDKGYGVRGDTGQRRGKLSGTRHGSDKSSRADQTSSKGSTVKTYSYGGNGWYKEDVEGEEVDTGGGRSENKGNFGGDYKKQYQEAAAPHHLYRGGQNGYYREHSYH